MLSEKAIVAELEFALELEAHDEAHRRKYDWLENAEGISWNDFCNSYSNHKLWFYTLLDISPDNGTGWQQLALNFGLKTEEIMWCEKYCGPSGPTSAVFNKLSSKPTGTPSLHHILHHLHSLGRHDLLTRIPWLTCIQELKEQLIKEKALNNVISLQSSEPPSPHLSQSVAVKAAPSKASSRPYACSIMMIYAADGKEFAMKATAQLRSKGVNENRAKIGVLLLNEQKRMLMADPSSTLYKWFMQVDFLVPVLTPELLQHFNNWQSDAAQNNGQNNYVDNDVMTPLHNRFIYRLAFDHYITHYSRNVKCRPVCPAAFKSQVCGSDAVLSHGLLQVVTPCEDYSDSLGNTVSMEKFAQLLIESPRVSF